MTICLERLRVITFFCLAFFCLAGNSYQLYKLKNPLVSPQDWAKYIEYLNEVKKTNLVQYGDEFRWFNKLLIENSGKNPTPENINHSVKNMESFPFEFRSILVAYQIFRGDRSPKLIQQAKQYALAVNLSFKRVMDYNLVFSYSENNQDHYIPIRLYDEHDWMKWSNAWFHWDQLGSESSSTQNEQDKKIEYLRLLLSLVNQISPDKVVALLMEFDHGKNSLLENKEIRHQFFHLSLALLEKLNFHYGNISLGKNHKIHVSVDQGKSKKFYQLVETAKKWYRTDIDFLIENISTMVSKGIYDWSDFFDIKLSEAEKSRLLMNKSKLSINEDIGWGLDILLLKHSEKSNLNSAMINSVVKNLSQLKNYYHGFIKVELSLGTKLDPQYARQLLTEAFAEAQRCQCLSIDNLLALAESSLMYSSHFEQFEKNKFVLNWISVASHFISVPNKSALLHKMMNSANNQELMFQWVRYMNKTVSAEEIEVITKQVKEINFGTSEPNQDRFVRELESRSKNLLDVVSALNPKDLQLIQYLEEIYINQDVSARYSPQDALNVLLKSNSRNPKLLKVILNRLSTVGLGDTIGTFRALVRLFPNESKAIYSIVYNHLREVKLAVDMISVLVEESIENRALLSSMKKYFSNLKQHSDAERQLYRQKFLHEFVEIQMDIRTKKMCAQVYGG